MNFDRSKVEIFKNWCVHADTIYRAFEKREHGVMVPTCLLLLCARETNTVQNFLKQRFLINQ